MERSSINCWLRALRNLTNFDQQLSPLRNVRQIGTKPSGSQVHWSLFSNLCFYPHENSFRLSFYTSTLSYVGTLRAFGLEVFTQVFLFCCCFFSTVVPWSSSSRWEEVQLDIIMETSWADRLDLRRQMMSMHHHCSGGRLAFVMCPVFYYMSIVMMFMNCKGMPDICQFWDITRLFSPVKVHQNVRKLAAK